MNSQLICQNIWVSPSNIKRSHACRNEAKDSKQSLPENKTILNKVIEKSLITPFPHFPLETPKISRLVYNPTSTSHTRRIEALHKISKSSLGHEETALPYLPKHNKNRASSIPNTSHLDPLPLPLKHWEYTDCIYSNKRPNLNFPLTIIVFEGIIGDFYKQSLWDSRSSDMSLCPGWIKGLSALYQKSFVCIISSLPNDKCDFILDLFSYNNVKIDSFYRRKGDQLRYIQDYSQILDEFSNPNTILISSIGLDSEEIQIRQAWDLIYEPTMSYHKKIYTSMWPIANFNTYDLPSILLIPNPRAQNIENCILFGEIAKVALKMIKSYRKGENLEKLCFESKGILRYFSIPQKNMMRNANGEYKGVVFAGDDAYKRPYVRNYYSSVKNQIDLAKYNKHLV